jgi:hypothetical protein
VNKTLENLHDDFWENTGPDSTRNIEESGICFCWIQLLEWEKKRLLVGHRFKGAGDLFWNYSGVLTNLSREKVKHLMKTEKSFPKVIWELYNMKMGLENYYKNLLQDLGLHHPPCRELQRNAGFYALGTLAYTLAMGVEMIGSRGMNRGETKRKDGKKRKRSLPRTMRVWRIIRRYFTLPAKIRYRARTITVEFLEVSKQLRWEFEKFWENILKC